METMVSLSEEIKTLRAEEFQAATLLASIRERRGELVLKLLGINLGDKVIFTKRNGEEVVYSAKFLKTDGDLELYYLSGTIGPALHVQEVSVDLLLDPENGNRWKKHV